MMPLALDLTSFSEDIAAGRLPPSDWPRAVRAVGAHAMDVPLPLLLGLDPLTTGPALRAEMEKRGVVLAAVRDTQSLCALDEGPSYFGAPRWTGAFWDACTTLVEGHWGAGLLVVRPPCSTALAAYNRLVTNLARAQRIASEWALRLAATNESGAGYLALAQDVPGLGLALDGDVLPDDGTARLRALDAALPHLRVLRLLADGSRDDVRVLSAWRNMLDAARFEGFISVSWQGTGDPYSGAGTAIRLLSVEEASSDRPTAAPLDAGPGKRTRKGAPHP